LSLDRFTDSFVVKDNWKDLNLRQLDVTMGQKWMQKELRRRFGIDGGYMNTDLRTSSRFGHHPHVRADFTCLPFPDNWFKLILFDPPFLVSRNSISGHDYRACHFAQYTSNLSLKSAFPKLHPNDKYTGKQLIDFGAWPTRIMLRKMMFKAFTELRRVLAGDGRIIFKWTDSDQSLKWALSLKNGLETDRIWKRQSGGGKLQTTYYVWLKKPVIRGGE